MDFLTAISIVERHSYLKTGAPTPPPPPPPPPPPGPAASSVIITAGVSVDTGGDSHYGYVDCVNPDNNGNNDIILYGIKGSIVDNIIDLPDSEDTVTLGAVETLVFGAFAFYYFQIFFNTTVNVQGSVEVVVGAVPVLTFNFNECIITQYDPPGGTLYEFGVEATPGPLAEGTVATINFVIDSNGP